MQDAWLTEDLYQDLISTPITVNSRHVDRTDRDGLRGQWVDQGQQTEETLHPHLAGKEAVLTPHSTQLIFKFGFNRR